MNPEDKAKVLKMIAVAQDTCFVKENVYKCADDGMVCFNGAIAELIYGKQYEFEDIEQSVWESISDAVTEDYITDMWNEKPADVSDEEWQKKIDEALEDWTPEVDTYEETVSEMSEMISRDAENLYESVDTLQEINDLHYRWISELIPFDVAMAELERLIVNYE